MIGRVMVPSESCEGRRRVAPLEHTPRSVLGRSSTIGPRLYHGAYQATHSSSSGQPFVVPQWLYW
eukprot:3132782-Rhodomonas_salina.2